MGLPLTQDRLNILRSFVEAGDRIGYYEQLFEYGYGYGALARGVVENDIVAGKVANEYFEAVVGEGVNPDTLARLSQTLMIEDFNARVEQANSGDLTSDLSVFTIQNYHNSVFRSFGFSEDAWTPNIAINSIVAGEFNEAFGRARAEAFWDNLVENTFTSNFISYVDLLDQAVTQPTFTYLQNLLEARIQGTTSQSNEFGNYIILTPLRDGLVVAGDQNNNDGGNFGTPDLVGSFGNDILMGFDGSDDFIGTSGNDVYYGGEGSSFFRRYDEVDYSSFTTGITVFALEDSILVDKGTRGLDVLNEIQAVIGTNQADRFEVDGLFTSTLRFIGNSSPVFQQEASGGRRLSAAQTAAQLELEGIQFSPSGTEDTVVVAQSLLDAGGRVTYLTPQGQGVVHLGDLKVVYEGVFFEPEQLAENFFAGLPEGGSVHLDEVGNILLNFSDITVALGRELLDALPLLSLVDVMGGTSRGDRMQLSDFGMDAFNGLDGDDVFFADGGSFQIQGGDGYDRVDYSLSDAAVTIDMSGGESTGDAAGDGYQGIEAISGSSFGDTYIAGDEGLTVSGLGGDDTLTGGIGNDSFLGGSGEDLLEGGEGADRLVGGSGDDMLYGGTGNDTLVGGDGDDMLFGEDGNDRFISGAGADAIVGGAGRDQVRFSRADTGVTVNMIDGSQNTGDAFGDTYEGIEAVIGTAFRDVLVSDNSAHDLFGGDGDDSLLGAGGNDRLFGGDGNDILLGGRGDDVLRGDAGNDLFVVRTDEGRDRVLDFTQGEDAIFFTGGPASFAELNITTNSAGTVVESGIGAIVLLGFFDTLTESDFLFRSSSESSDSRGNDADVMLGELVETLSPNVSVARDATPMMTIPDAFANTMMWLAEIESLDLDALV